MTNIFNQNNALWLFSKIAAYFTSLVTIPISALLIAFCYATLITFLSRLMIAMLAAAAFLFPAVLYLSPFVLIAPDNDPIRLMALHIFHLYKTIIPLPVKAVYACYHNFGRITMALANSILTKIGFTPISFGLLPSFAEINKMRMLRNLRIQSIDTRYNIDREHEKIFRNVRTLSLAASDYSIQDSYTKSINSFINQALDEYMQFLSEKGIIACSVSFSGDIEKINSLQKWYILRTRNRTVCWTIAKEFALISMQNDADSFVNGITTEDIIELETNSKWCCQISKSLMRNPVYVVLSNGNKVYYEYLNLAKWISQPTSNPEHVDRLPETREKITEFFFDLELKQEIQSAIEYKRNKSRFFIESFFKMIAKITYSLFNIVFLAYNIYKAFMAIPQLDYSNYKDLADPYKDVILNDYERLPSEPKKAPLWHRVYNPNPGYNIYDPRLAERSTLEEYMQDLEVNAEVKINELQGHIEHDNTLLPIHRSIAAQRHRPPELTERGRIQEVFLNFRSPTRQNMEPRIEPPTNTNTGPYPDYRFF